MSVFLLMFDWWEHVYAYFVNIQMTSSGPGRRQHQECLDWGCVFFVSDVISVVVFGPVWLMLPGLGPNR